MKLPYYQNYSIKNTRQCESVLLTAWAVLREFKDDFVLVGGLVPRYICKATSKDLQAVTIDVDFGVSLGMSSGLYETTRNRLKNSGFEWEDKRFVKKIGKIPLYLDFITDKPEPDSSDSVMVDDIPVSAVFGVQRALDVFREVEIRGKDLYGADVTEKIKVCEVGPYICLKLQAYANRAQSKDVFDFVTVVKNYDKGVAEAVRLFRREQKENLSFEKAIEILKERFQDEKSKGPLQYADFCLGGLDVTNSDVEFRKKQLIHEALNVANSLKNNL